MLKSRRIQYKLEGRIKHNLFRPISGLREWVGDGGEVLITRLENVHCVVEEVVKSSSSSLSAV